MRASFEIGRHSIDTMVYHYYNKSVIVSYRHEMCGVKLWVSEQFDFCSTDSCRHKNWFMRRCRLCRIPSKSYSIVTAAWHVWLSSMCFQLSFKFIRCSVAIKMQKIVAHIYRKSSHIKVRRKDVRVRWLNMRRLHGNSVHNTHKPLADYKFAPKIKLLCSL